MVAEARDFSNLALTPGFLPVSTGAQIAALPFHFQQLGLGDQSHICAAGVDTLFDITAAIFLETFLSTNCYSEYVHEIGY